MRIAGQAWWLYLLAMAVLAIAYLAGPLNYGPAFNAIGFSAVIAIPVGVRINRSSSRVPWYLIALGQALFVTGDVLSYNYTSIFGTALPFPSVADLAYLPVAPVTVTGLVLLIRKRSPGRDLPSLLDAAVVTTGLALLSWVFLIAPYAHNGSLNLESKLVAIAYPLGDIMMLGVGIRMVVGSGRRSPAYYLLISAIIALTVTDSIYGWIELHGTYNPGDPLDAGWIAYYVLLGAAALHPSMATLTHRAAPQTQLTRMRIIGIVMAVLVAPIVTMFTLSSKHGGDAFVIGGAAIVLFGLVVVRMIGLARAQESTARLERTMREAADSLVTATSRREIVRAARDAATKLAGAAAVATVFEVDSSTDAGRLIAGQDDAGAQYAIEVASLPEAVTDRFLRRQPVEIPNARALLGAPAPAAPAFMVPLLVRGELGGALAVLDASTVSVALRRSLVALAAQVAIALESAALTERVLRSETEAWFGALVQNSSDVIFVLDADTTVRYVSPSVESMLQYPPGELIGRQLSAYIRDDDRVLLHPLMAIRPARASQASEAIEFRVRHQDGRWLHTESSVTNLTDNRAVGGIVVNMRDITERKRFEHQLAHQAFHDPVTGLANRALFRDRTEHALSTRWGPRRMLAVLFLDLDNFKSINDTAGHAAGDELLQTIGARLANASREGDTVARLGGDEFGVLLENIPEDSLVGEIALRLLATVREPLVVDGRELSIRCSIGIAVASADDEVTVDELLRNADVAMYQAKSRGGDTHALFAHEMHAALVEQLELRAGLSLALESDELSLYYQPIYDLRTNQISGYEALLRWDRGGEAISPACFIPVAEHSGLIVPIGRWVLERACADAVAFESAAPGSRRTIAVNISARQLQRIEIIDEVRHALRTSGLDPSLLVLEITESMMIDDVDLAIERLEALRSLGVLVAVDDFGTGYSSLNYIRRLPIDILKIDRSFIEGIDTEDAQVVDLTAAIVDLARVLRLRCVAEGVERPAQYEQLKRLGCQLAQGYLFAAPMSAGSVVQQLQTDPLPQVA